MPSFFKNPFKKEPKPAPLSPPSPPSSLPPSPQLTPYSGWGIPPPRRRGSSTSPPRRYRRNSSPSPPRLSRPTITRRPRRSPSPPVRRPRAPSPVTYSYLSSPIPPPKPQPPSSFPNAPRHWVTPLPGSVPVQPPQYHPVPPPKRPLTPPTPFKRSPTPPPRRPIPNYWAPQPAPPPPVPSRSPSPTLTIYSRYPGPPSPITTAYTPYQARPSPSSSVSSFRLYGRPPSPPAPPPTCPNCKSRPVAPNPSGGFFDFCTKTCAAQSKKASLCEHCKQRPKYKDGSKEHAYCGLKCAGAAANNRTNTPNPPVPPKPYPSPPQPSPSGPICQIPGCTLPVFVHPDGAASNFCMTTHKNWGERGCISCRTAPMSDKSVMCTTCHESSLGKAPMIIQVHKDHENFKSVEKQFTKSWRHGTQCPKVTAVYKIIGTEASTKLYYKYLDRVESEGNFVSMSKSRGNENRRWHGTKRTCYLGDQGNTKFCTSSNCSLCCIIKTSFDLSFFKGATGWGRFGAGIYTSSTSSKSNDYSKNENINSDWKALLLNKVVVGNGKKLIQDDTSLTEPPPTFHSVLAEVAPGGSLNYDELVVYTNDAVRPSYLVMYENPDVPRV